MLRVLLSRREPLGRFTSRLKTKMEICGKKGESVRNLYVCLIDVKQHL
jgi:hypothetical protein